MRITLVSGLVGLVVLSACSAGVGSNVRGEDDHIAVCQEQASMARRGKVSGGAIAISCPEHGIGEYY